MLTIRAIADGRTTLLPAVPAHPPEGGYVWIDLVGPTTEEQVVLRELGLGETMVEAMLEDTRHPRVVDGDGYLDVVVHAVDLDASAFEFSTQEIDVVVAEGWLVTHSTQPVDAVASVARRLPSAVLSTPTRLLYALLDTLVDVYLPFLELLDERIDEVEALIFADRPDPRARDEIYFLRRDVITLRRIAVPQTEALRDLARRLEEEGGVGEPALAPWFRELRDKLARMADLADSYRSVLDGALDQYRSQVANAQNEVMKVLTMLSGILLPITVVTGLYGMNFEYMPELDERWGYPFVLALNATIVVVGLLVFRAKGWIGGRRGRPAEAPAEHRVLRIPAVGRALRVPGLGARALRTAAAAPVRSGRRLVRRRAPRRLAPGADEG